MPRPKCLCIKCGKPQIYTVEWEYIQKQLCKKQCTISTNFDYLRKLHSCTLPSQRSSSAHATYKNNHFAKSLKNATCMHVSRQECTDPYVGVKVGQAKHPGPAETRQDTNVEDFGKQGDNSQGYKLLIANVTNLITNGYLLTKQACNAMIVSEHYIRQFQTPHAKQILGGSCKICLSELDPEVSNNLGGVGIIHVDDKHNNKPNAKHPELQEVCGNGRVDIYCIEPIKNQFILIYSLYGWTNGDCCTANASRTDDLVALCLADCALRPKGPKMIVGDLNASVQNLPHLNEIIQEGNWFDLGARATLYGASINCEPTCKANAGAKASRKDYAIANAEAEQLIGRFYVNDATDIPVHSIFEITFKEKAPTNKYKAVALPTSIQEVFNTECKKAYGQSNMQAAETRREEKVKQSKKCLRGKT